ncbi:uncharacterized protein LOC130629617 isoform X2 [Hydractinia symbiolongicarpus]|uniref:uncharacterized protein LOC130629617 isoform X2 n=1 Tax=Hydractinia symbiolongicarpus TaxID=13093 RepID=UPI00254A7360|nr:uncharacterized protein LOC130629617 isoform X2 [Hydractinia symbiolongicarpus]
MAPKNIIKLCEFWLKLCLYIENFIKPALLNVLHNVNNRGSYQGLPSDPNRLYNDLRNHLAKLTKLKDKKIINSDQWLLLFPGNQQTDSSKFDTTLIILLIINCTTFPPPNGGWKQKCPAATDTTIGAFILHAREFRNLIIHYANPDTLEKSEFNNIWSQGDKILNGLGYTEDTSGLKHDSIDPTRVDYFRVFLNHLQCCQEQLQRIVDENTTDISNLQGLAREVIEIKENTSSIKDCISNLKEDVNKGKKELNVEIANKINNVLARIHHLNETYEKEIAELNNRVLSVEEKQKKYDRGIEAHTNILNDHEKRLGKLEKEGCHSPFLEKAASDIQSYTLFKNHQSNLVVKFDENFFIQHIQATITNNSLKYSKQLEIDTDYVVETKNGKLLLMIYTSNMHHMSDLSITLKDNKNKFTCVSIKDIELATIHKCVASNHLNVITHNSGVISKHIESILKKETKEADVEFIYGGSLRRMSAKEYEEYGKNYSDQYFTIDGKCMEEPLQFPPPICNQTSSVFAQNIKNVILKLKYQLFTIFTHYDTKDHIQFLKLDEEFPLNNNLSNDNRILLVFFNTIINIRYNNTTNAFDIQDEFKAGETDLMELSLINKKIFKNGNWAMVNVVAAPNFEVSQDTEVCVNCNLLCKKTLSEESKILDFFSNLLQNAHEKSSSANAKEQYITMVSKIMCFMATRKALYTVPSLSDNIHEQISSLILSIQQLRILYSKCQKKIITGPLGSGKTVLGLSHLELAYEYCEENSIIFYVIWDDKTLLKQDVVNYANRFNYKSNVDVIVTDIVELAKDLKMQKVLTPFQLLKSLVQKHVGKKLHFIFDEFNGEMLGIEEALSLKQYFKMEAKLENSFIVLLPQSIEKHRSFVLHETITKHDKYKYEETGLKLYKLERAMRTSELNFQFLRAFENKASKEKTTIKLPLKDSQAKANKEAKQKNNTGFFRKILQKFFARKTTPCKQEQQKSVQSPNQSQQQPHPSQQQPQPPQQQPPQQQQPKENTMHHMEFGEKDIDGHFEAPIDIDRVAAAIQDEHLSEDVRTDIHFNFNSAAFIGHNIKGTKPLLIHPEEKKTEEEFIATLALVLQDICLHYNVKRLFIYNTYHQMTIFYRLLKLLKIEFLQYDESTDWKILKSNEEIPNLLQYSSYNILTTPEGSRGMEASECICLIENNDRTLKHLTLESMSRATQNLIIVSTSNINQSKLDFSTGHIISELLSLYLMEYLVTHSKDLDTEKPYTNTTNNNAGKVVFNVNTRSWQFEELLNNIKDINPPETVLEIKNVTEIIFKNLHPPEKVDKITCLFLSEKSCELRWQHSADKYTVKKKSNDFDWKILASGITSNTFIVDDISIGEICTFSVVASNQVGQSDDSIFSYHHNWPPTFEDIVEIIKSNDIKKLKKLLSIHPNIVHMRDEYETTPLLWTVRYTNNNTSMVEMLISYGSDVWAEDRWKENSYHLAATYDRHTILDMLCRHDVTNINRVDVFNFTPLHYAVMYGHISCVDVLLRHENIDVTIEDIDGYTAYDVAGGWNALNREIILQKIKEYAARKK